MSNIETTTTILEESRDQIIDIINELDTGNYFDRYRMEELDYDLGQIEMEISEYNNKN
jgi:hypothetical protein